MKIEAFFNIGRKAVIKLLKMIEKSKGVYWKVVAISLSTFQIFGKILNTATQ